MADNLGRYHIAMFPWFAFGHMTPYLDLSNELAQRGHKISLLLPEKAQLQLQNANFHPNLITFYTLPVPQVKGLPPSTETAFDIPLSLTFRLAAALDLTRDRVKQTLLELKPDFVFYDFAHWVPDLASKLGFKFKTVSYNVVSAATITRFATALGPASKNQSTTSEELIEPPAGYPSSTVVLRKHERHQSSFIFMEFGDGITFYERLTTARRKCDTIAIRTCRELEGPFCDYIADNYGKPLLLTGPVLPDPAMAPLEHHWAKFLGSFEPVGHGHELSSFAYKCFPNNVCLQQEQSVVFCAFGSQWILEKPQFQELVLAAELTGLPFLIALKPPNGYKTVDEALPDGFKERTRGRGIVHGEMVQQRLILSHPSVGCFVSHGGFGSMWESLMSSCQIVLLPHLGDHILNTRLLADELKTGVEVERDENGWFTKQDLCKAIKCVMDKDSEIVRLVKKNHAKWKEILAEPSFMKNYIENFITGLHGIGK